MKRCAPDKHAEYLALKAAINESNNLMINESDNSKKLTQESISFFIIKFLIIACSLPYRIVETAGFKAFMKLICPKWSPISRYHVQQEIQLIRAKNKDKIIMILNNVKDLSLTIDLWTDRKGLSYLGITCHFINEKFEFMNIVIAMRLMKEKKLKYLIYYKIF